MTPSPPAAQPAPTDRGHLARLALEAALAVPGVAGAVAGPGLPRVTVDATGRMLGVSATAQADGRYAVDLCLVADLVPLHPLADRIRTRVRGAVTRAGVGGALGGIDVEFADLAAPRPGAAGLAGGPR